MSVQATASFDLTELTAGLTPMIRGLRRPLVRHKGSDRDRTRRRASQGRPRATKRVGGISSTHAA